MFDTVLVPVQQGPGSRRAVEAAVTLAASFDATLHALAVVERPRVLRSDVETDGASGESGAALEATAADVLDGAVETAEAAGVEALGRVRSGVPFRETLVHAEETDADVVVVASEGAREASRRGEFDAARIVGEADCSVLVVD
jgi:nucleotide-binding universal stress UspA family protein